MAVTPTISQVEALLRAGRLDAAARLLTAAAEAGQADGLSELALWRITGDIIRRDLAAARELLARAGAAGDRDAALLHASFLASGTGGPDQWANARAVLTHLAPNEPRAAAQLLLLNAMDLDAKGFPTKAISSCRISSIPHVVIVENFMSAAECAYLSAAAEPILTPSLVVDPATGRPVTHPIRISDGAIFGVHTEDLVVNALNRRIAALSKTRPDEGEPLQVLRYRRGGEYRPHMDALFGESNQRILTVLVYLNEGYEGGETHFPHVGLRVRGRTGQALLFRNIDPDGRPEPLAQHAGLPVTSGAKLIASRWIRARTFSFPPPRPILDF